MNPGDPVTVLNIPFGQGNIVEVDEQVSVRLWPDGAVYTFRPERILAGWNHPKFPTTKRWDNVNAT